MKTRERYDYGEVWLSTGGMILVGAVICLFAETIGLGGLVAAGLAAYVLLAIAGAVARADR
jgi:hypothetical protein